MKRLLYIIAIAACGCAPVTPIVPVVEFGPINPLVAAVAPLDGQWALTNIDGTRSCLTIQELHVSIFARDCGTDPTGFVPRIIDSPEIARAGDTITLTLLYNVEIFSEVTYRTSFSGAMQIDGSFKGTRIDTFINPDPRIIPDQPPQTSLATLSRM